MTVTSLACNMICKVENRSLWKQLQATADRDFEEILVNMISEESWSVLRNHLRLIFISVRLGQFLTETNQSLH